MPIALLVRGPNLPVTEVSAPIYSYLLRYCSHQPTSAPACRHPDCSAVLNNPNPCKARALTQPSLEPDLCSFTRLCQRLPSSKHSSPNYLYQPHLFNGCAAPVILLTHPPTTNSLLPEHRPVRIASLGARPSPDWPRSCRMALE